MDGGRQAEEKQSGPVPAAAEEAHHEGAERQRHDAVGVRRTDEPDRVDGVGFCDASEEDENRSTCRDQHVTGQRIRNQRQRLKAHDPQHTADGDRQRPFRHPGGQQNSKDLVKNRPELRVVDIEWVAGGIFDQPGDYLGRLNSDLPVGEGARADMPSQRSAEDQHAGDRPA